MKIMSLVLPYLLLVSFGVNFHSLDQQKINLINQSPYQGVAIPLISAYDTRKYDWRDFAEPLKRIKPQAQKQIWPWVFFNRFYGVGTEAKSIPPLAKSLYFRNIKGMDLYNQAGALADFYHLWRLSLRAAKELGSPGLFVDPEPYNNHRLYQLSYLADQMGRSPEEIKKRLQAVGGQLIKITAEEYPGAILWFTFTGLVTPKRFSRLGPRELRTPTFLVQGMLEQAKTTGAKIKLISGGEISLGYCHKSFAQLKTALTRRRQNFAPLLAKYPDLKLAGTIAPWADVRQKRGWTLRGGCAQATMQNLQDFKPLIRELLKTYDYVWIYAASSAGYRAYDPRSAAIYNQALEEIMASRPAN